MELNSVRTYDVSLICALETSVSIERLPLVSYPECILVDMYFR
jgi:hypothetical protein